MVREGRQGTDQKEPLRIEGYQQNSEQSNSTVWKKIKERQPVEDNFTPRDRIYRNLNKDNLSSLDLEIYNEDDPELIRIMTFIKKLRSREMKPEDLSVEDAEVVAEVLSKI